MKENGYFGVSEYEYRKEIINLHKEIEELKKQNMDVTIQLNSVQKELSDTLASKSWKVTKPLRSITSHLSKGESLIKNKETQMEDLNHYTRFPCYVSTYQNDEDFSHLETDIKALAFYLPQYHTFKENDEWWGKGFTDWTNTKKSVPKYEGQYQPREPHDDIGYYTLDTIETIQAQIELAKKHGLYGFCFYYYWFSGKRLMEKPVDILLEHKEVKFPFLLCWANENWSRTWDGLDTEVLMKQGYREEDYAHFIRDIKKYLQDERYIRIDGKPVIMIYNPYQIPDIKKLCESWRLEAKKQGIGEIVIWCKNNLSDTEFERADFVDAEFDFAPHGFILPNDYITGLSSSKIINYAKLIKSLPPLYTNHFPAIPFYYSCTMGWDNSARRKADYTVYHNYHLEDFYRWMRLIIEKTRKSHPKDRRFIFINAWNEWAEGTYLEPDKKYGYASINTFSRAIYDIPFKEKFLKMEGRSPSKKPDLIAVQLHLYHIDLIEEVKMALSNIPYPFDLYISVQRQEDIETVKGAFQKLSNIRNIIVEVFENRGRDILPMLLQMNEKIKDYTYFCHIHTKKSVETSYGNEWRKYLFHHLFGSSKNVVDIIEHFEEDEKLGILYPVTYKAIAKQIDACFTKSIGGNLENLKDFCNRLSISSDTITEDLSFPTGSMFWAKVDAILGLFTVYTKEDFEEEKGQVDGTLAHAIERGICLLAHKNGYESRAYLNVGDKI